MKKTTKTLFVVLNGFHAVMMRNSGSSVQPKIETIWSTEMETGAELRPRDHRPGRVYQSMCNRRSAYEARDVVGHQRKIFLEKILNKVLQKFVGTEAFPILGIFNHQILELVHMAGSFKDRVRCQSSTLNLQHSVLENKVRSPNGKNIFFQ